MKKIVTTMGLLVFFSGLYADEIGNPKIKVKKNRLILTSDKSYTYRGEMEIEIENKERKAQDIYFTLEKIEKDFKIMDVKVDREDGPQYKFKADSEGKGKIKITYNLRHNGNINRSVDEQRIDIFRIKGRDGWKGYEILSTKVDYLAQAEVSMRATGIDFGRVEISKANKEGAVSKKNSTVAIDYTLNKKINNSNLSLTYPKEVYLKHKTTKDAIKVTLEDTAYQKERDTNGERIKITLPIAATRGNERVDILGKIAPVEFKDKELGDYFGVARVRVYYDFISSHAPEEKNYRPVVRR